MENEYYGSPTASDAKPLYERLRDYYEATDFVTVINTDTNPLVYQFMNPANEQFISNAPYHGEIHRTAPTVVRMQPGETKLCPAFEADAMIVTLIKKITTQQTHGEIEAGRLNAGKGADWTDPTTQTTLIGRILVGKKDLLGEYNQNQTKVDVDKDLGIEPTERPKVGRPRKTEEGA